MNADAIGYSLSVLSSLKALLNELWKNEIHLEKANVLSLIAAKRYQISTNDAFEIPSVFSNSIQLRARLEFLEVLLAAENKTPPRFFDIGVALWISQRTEEQKVFSELIMKLDREAEAVWLAPEHLSEIRAEKIALLTKKIFETGKKTHPLFKQKEGAVKLLANN
ncbi:hypothetical protein GW915_13460 [bacterium]|nr:hypothetical protein [bacterium]